MNLGNAISSLLHSQTDDESIHVHSERILNELKVQGITLFKTKVNSDFCYKTKAAFLVVDYTEHTVEVVTETSTLIYELEDTPKWSEEEYLVLTALHNGKLKTATWVFVFFNQESSKIHLLLVQSTTDSKVFNLDYIQAALNSYTLINAEKLHPELLAFCKRPTVWGV